VFRVITCCNHVNGASVMAASATDHIIVISMSNIIKRLPSYWRVIVQARSMIPMKCTRAEKKLCSIQAGVCMMVQAPLGVLGKRIVGNTPHESNKTAHGTMYFGCRVIKSV
jgi:hypothetical protein